MPSPCSHPGNPVTVTSLVFHAIERWRVTKADHLARWSSCSLRIRKFWRRIVTRGSVRQASAKRTLRKTPSQNIHERRDSRKTLSLPFAVVEVYPQMTQEIPLYAADGTPWGFRSLETAQRLIANGLVSPAYGRKGHLKAIFSKKADGSSPVERTGHRGEGPGQSHGADAIGRAHAGPPGAARGRR